jgi:hypothetical protein
MSPEGFTHLLTVPCTFSKWLEAFLLKDEKAGLPLPVEASQQQLGKCSSKQILRQTLEPPQN